MSDECSVCGAVVSPEKDRIATCHQCDKFLCQDCTVFVWYPNYPGLPVSICLTCQNQHNWPLDH